MDEARQFASLMLACQLGAIPKAQVIERANQRISEVDKPSYWLIELASDGESSELAPLIESADDQVFTEALRVAFQAWNDEKLTNHKFAGACQKLWQLAGFQSRWYSDLVWVPDEFDLVEEGTFVREESVRKIKTFFLSYLRR